MKLEHPADTPENARQHSMSDGAAVVIGCSGGAAGGLLLGLVIAAATVPLFSLTSAIVILHVTLAMIAMGAWCVPSIVSDPANEQPRSSVAIQGLPELTVAPVQERSGSSARQRDPLASEISAAL